MLLHLKPEQVEIGMFVDAFDGRWIDHPFWRSRFLIETADQLARIRASGVNAVIVDRSRSRMATDAAADVILPDDRRQSARGLAPPCPGVERRRANIFAPPPGEHPVRPASYAQERRRAERLIAKSKQAVVDLFGAARMGRAVEARRMASLAEAVGKSITRQSRAMIDLVRLKQKDEYTYLHSVAVCALMINFARHLKLDEAEVQALGVAGLLHDVGKVAIADDVLFKPGKLTTCERSAVEVHPEAGHAFLMKSQDIPAAAFEVCLRHHEKMDGTGYPGGLSGEALSLYARMGAICDVYDAVTSDRPYKAAWTPCEALTAMQGWAGHFDPHLLDQFADSLGIFPTGTLVTLSSGMLAIVVGSAGAAGETIIVRVFFDCDLLAECAPSDLEIGPAPREPRIMGRASHKFWRFDDWPATAARVLAEPVSPTA
ncbi:MULTISPECIES: HD-GYP domain-containing protein [unclassified Sphingopyxis]|uniref:HD-GYP domain-containing protein n=1 Tax=unclassified Sphingopyxis TaxID=2614943 RepID=UPI002866826A|nr:MULTISPECIES: HD-GYP domain-containing protein [unclassified Sphingopyxis]MDR6835007.1 HD-GYP domain-containing protein (c-di-GMP phosphodiesterase class II) [Sphingopyxis sp. BE122]MDR7227278.1 HD-GYP domain-containing protein (c-di-GMP phosphodiesterase class II) [Sphingopyxis sp. BE259]